MRQNKKIIMSNRTETNYGMTEAAQGFREAVSEKSDAQTGWISVKPFIPLIAWLLFAACWLSLSWLNGKMYIDKVIVCTLIISFALFVRAAEKSGQKNKS